VKAWGTRVPWWLVGEIHVSGAFFRLFFFFFETDAFFAFIHHRIGVMEIGTQV